MGLTGSKEQPRSASCEELRHGLSPSALAALDAYLAGGAYDAAAFSSHFPGSRLVLRVHAASPDEESLTLALALAAKGSSEEDSVELAARALQAASAGEEQAAALLLADALHDAGVPASASELQSLCAGAAAGGLGARAWARGCPALLAQLRSSLGGPSAPCTRLQRGCAGDLLLTPALAWWLRPHLAATVSDSWTLLFSSATHGASFRTLSGRCTGRGAVLLLVRDKQGRLAAAASDVPLAKRAAFAGGYGCRLAALLPGPVAYRPTGSNENLFWFAESFESVPNGIGCGGQVGHFGLFVGASMESGHSRYSATYANKPLLGEPGDIAGRFDVDAIEMWSIDSAALEEAEEAEERARRRAAAGGSVLDVHAATRSFIGIALDRGSASEGYRES